MMQCADERAKLGHRWDFIGIEKNKKALWICPYCQQKIEIELPEMKEGILYIMPVDK